MLTLLALVLHYVRGIFNIAHIPSHNIKVDSRDHGEVGQGARPPWTGCAGATIGIIRGQRPRFGETEYRLKSDPSDRGRWTQAGMKRKTGMSIKDNATIRVERSWQLQTPN